MTPELPHLVKIIPYLLASEEIPHVLMLQALNEAIDGVSHERRRDVASNFMKEAGEYLPDTHLLAFIKADMTDAETRQLITERKALVRRLSILLPSVINLLAIKDEWSIRSALHQIHDCCAEYHAIEGSEYSSKQWRKILQDLNAVAALAKDLEAVLERAELHIDIDFDHHEEAVQRVSSTDDPPTRLSEFRRLLGVLRFSSDLVLYKDQIGERALYVGDNRARTHIVEYTYRIAVQCDAPKFATTPGSDFSVLCGLIYELATGNADEGLAGAISKFSRSDLRRQIDEDEALTRYENSEEGTAEREADNFADVKNAIKSGEAEAKFWRSMLVSKEWDEFEIAQIRIRLSDTLARRENALKQHGPFIVWASQISSTERLALRDIMDDYERRNLEFAETVGRRIRSERN